MVKVDYTLVKRVFLITENLGSGGAERQLCGLAIMLKERGYTVRVVTYVHKQFYEPLLRKAGVDYHFADGAFDKRHRFPILLKELKDFKPDIIISFLPSVSISMCILRLAYHCPLIVSERNYTLNWNWKTKLRYNLYRLAKYVVPNSHAEAENISTHCKWLASKTIPIQNFTDTELFTPADTKPQNDVFSILCVGRVTPQKNILKFIEAVAQTRDHGFKFKVTWVGSHKDSEYVDKVKTLINSYNLSDVMELQDQTSNIAEMYRQADAFCLPSIFEGYPNVLCEAMASGLPVICSNLQEMPRIVTEGRNGYMFNPHSVDDMASAIEKLINTPKDLLNIISIQNRSHVVSNNSMKSFTERYIMLIEKL